VQTTEDFCHLIDTSTFKEEAEFDFRLTPLFVCVCGFADALACLVQASRGNLEALAGVREWCRERVVQGESDRRRESRVTPAVTESPVARTSSSY